MAKTSKLEPFWYLLLLAGIVIFTIGSVSGLKELISRKTIKIQLAKFMAEPVGGSKFEFIDCAINYNKYVSYTNRTLLGRQKNNKFFLLEPRDTTSIATRYVLVKDGRIFSNKYKDVSNSKQEFDNIRAWVKDISSYQIKGASLEMAGNSNAEGVFMQIGYHPVASKVYYQFAIAFMCFIITFIRGAILNKLKKRRKLKGAQN